MITAVAKKLQNYLRGKCTNFNPHKAFLSPLELVRQLLYVVLGEGNEGVGDVL